MRISRAALVASVVLLACGGQALGPRAVADAFMHHVYVTHDTTAAAALASGSARERVTDGVLGTAGPVTVTLLSERSLSAGSATYVYRVAPERASVDGARDTVHVSVTVRDDGGWRVAAFSETEGPPTP